MYRVGNSPWAELPSATIGNGSWSGNNPFVHYGQGTLEYKPKNGLSIAPATVPNITVGEAFGLSGQSNAQGIGDNPQSYTPTNYTLLVFADGTWAQRSSDPWTGTTGFNGPYMRTAELFDQVNIPFILVKGHIQGTTGFARGNWNPGDPEYLLAVADMNAAGTGGWAGWMWDQAEDEVIFGPNPDFDVDFIAMHVAMQSAVDNGAGVSHTMKIIGERGGGAGLPEVRRDTIAAIDSRSDIFPGPPMYTMDFPDNTHPSTDAQLTWKGEAWFRCLMAGPLQRGGDSGYGPTISTTPQLQQDRLRLVFSGEMENHADLTGFTFTDDTGVLTVSSSAAVTEIVNNDSIDVIFTRNTDGDVILDFAVFEEAVGSTLVDKGSVVGFPPKVTENLNLGGYEFAPANVISVSLPPRS
jgi:hypothetical protein